MSEEIQLTPFDRHGLSVAMAHKLGRVLLKATQDCPFEYAAKLRTGELVRFEGAEYEGGEWIRLLLAADAMSSPGHQRHGLPINGERGVDVRLADIVWAADAPDGS